LNELIGGGILWKDMFYKTWKYDRIELKCLSESYIACKFNNLANFFLRDDDTRQLITWKMNKEDRIRKFEKGITMKNYFFDLIFAKVKHTFKDGYYSWVLEGFMAANDAKIGIHYTNEEWIIIWTAEDEKEKYRSKGELAKAVSTIFEIRHYEALIKQKCKG
jgi:hypothetical protein